MLRCCLSHLKNSGHLATAFIKLCDGQRINLKIVGKETEPLVRFLVVENDVAQILWIVFG
jgi:hypothetical protein